MNEWCGSLSNLNWGYATGKLQVKVSIKRGSEEFLALARFLLIRTALEIDSARDGTHCGSKVVMDKRRLNGDESTKVVRARSRGDRGQGEGACLNDFNLCDVRFHIIEAFLLHRSGVEVARDDAVFDKGHRVILKTGNRSELPDERASGLTRAKATSDEHTPDPGAV